MAAKKLGEIDTLKDVIFAFVKMQNPVEGFNKGSKEWQVCAVVSEDVADQWDEDHPKNAAVPVKNSDFLTKYKFDELPYPDQKKQFVIKFKKVESDGMKDSLRPRVFEMEGKLVRDVTFSKLIANGSKGHVEFSTFESKGYGVFTELKSILVTDLIEYESNFAAAGSSWGASTADLAEVPDEARKSVKNQGADDKDDDSADDATPAKKEEPKSKAGKPTPKAKPKADPAPDMDDDIPF